MTKNQQQIIQQNNEIIGLLKQQSEKCQPDPAPAAQDTTASYQQPTIQHSQLTELSNEKTI